MPLLTSLALDDEEQVKEALAAQLVPIIWWFFTHCQVIPDGSGSDPVLAQATISVQAFTPILGTLLLSPNPHVGGVARYAVVDLLERMRKADHQEAIISSSSIRHRVDDEDAELTTGLFGPQERTWFQEEILQQLVIGMGHLDVNTDYPVTPGVVSSEWENGLLTTSKNGTIAGKLDQSQGSECQTTNAMFNPYFPSTSDPPFSSVPNNLHSFGDPPDLSMSNSSLLTAEHNRLSHDTLLDHVDSMPSKQFSAEKTDPFSTHLKHAPSTEDIPSSMSQPVIPVSQLNPMLGRLSPELVDSLPPSSLGGAKGDMEYDAAHDRVFGPSWKCTCDNAYDHDDYEDQKAAVGRLSSMSLMAAVAASGTLDEETKQAFVKEVERVAKDPVPWVRTEASFALGALAKVVPEEVVQCSLRPLFDRLRSDAAWRVRHSAVFALPAILMRLRPHERRKLALETIARLATDESATVRLGVLEGLGEVLYTFHGDDEGVPDDLLNLFLGKKIDQSFPIDDQSGLGQAHSLDLFLQDSKRSLIRAFNYPAVVLALGKERWNDVRDLYLSLAASTEFKVRRTLAASLGELAKIIGEDNARRDLVRVWWNAIRSNEDEVRLKAVEVAETFSAALGPRVGASIIEGILLVWDEGILKTWRERDCVVKSLVNLSQWGQQVIPLVIYGLLGRALEDSVACVRESAVTALPPIRKTFSNQPDFLSKLHAHLLSLANATTYRKRMTFIACQQSLADSDEKLSHIINDDYLNAIEKLANDDVDGVRIGIARLVGVICEKLARNAIPITGTLLTLMRRLSHDNSHDVRAYIPDLSKIRQSPKHTTPGKVRTHDVYTFSRPPSYRVSAPGKRHVLGLYHDHGQSDSAKENEQHDMELHDGNAT